MGEVLLPSLIEGYGLQEGLRPRRVIADNDTFRIDLTDPGAGRVLARFHFALSTTSDGFADLASDSADLVMAVREVRPEEVARARDAGVGDLSAPRRTRTVALDALVPVVAAASPLTSLAPDVLAAIWSGEIDDWAALELEAGPIELHEIDSDTGFAEGFADRLLEQAGQTGTVSVRHHGTAATLVDTVAPDPWALGLTRFSEIGNARPLALTAPCGRILRATTASLKSEDYPLATPLLLYTPERRLPLPAREFLSWLTTPAAERVVRRAGFVDQVPDSTTLSGQGDRLANAVLAAGEEVSLADLQEMVRQMTGTRRLSTTFRFRNGTAQLDPQSESNVDRLARDLEAGVHDGRELVLAGFSDGEGPAPANLRLAADRAEAVARALREAAPVTDWSRVTLMTAAFGEAMPLACDDTEWGRRTNRRVEVWMR
ncbi:OmpA family protein [Aliiruegeria haliotis]